MLGELLIALPAIAVVPLHGIEPGLQVALRLAALALIATVAVVRGRGRATQVECALALFAILAVASTLIAGAPLGAALPVLAGLATLVLAARAGRVVFAGDRDRFERAVAVTTAVVAGIAALELLGVTLPWSYDRRPVSTLGNRNHVASYLAIALPILIASRRRWVLVGCALVVAVIVAARCRGAYVGGAAALVIVAALDRRAAWRAAPAIACGAALGLLPWPGVHFAPSVGDAASRVFELDRGSGLARVHQHQLAFEALHDRPGGWVLGLGAGAWEGVASQYAHRVSEHTPRFTGAIVPNSEPLRILTEQGLIGLCAAGLALGLMLGAARAYAPALAALSAAWVCGLVDPLLVHPECIALLGALAGIVAPPIRAPARRGAIALPAVVCAAALARVAAFRTASAERTAVELADRGDCDRANLALARFVAPHPYHWGARVQVARCFERTDQIPMARPVWRAALAIEPHLRELATSHLKGTDR